ncbi:uncharacterized protein EAF01_009035 [Botrytis porri]|uniref:Uncharacterized protein n=1 Tax=Botrytis porri TaxID=87229 RepID=A0A4Z1KER0_9HELO|nr:uncharacterized protein EAF01_009035 [Botrytis porri]KAF7896632.1 hypothetical protein EAF01_009035 [Botrytis porri]TGO84531.1 hypothetical protein BPOR_0494g00070 [Botrytis porri]
MASSTTIGIILVVVVVGTVCGLAGLYYWGNRGKGWSGPSLHTSRHSSRLYPLAPPRIIPPYRNGIPGARVSHISPEVPSPAVRTTSGRQATLQEDRQSTRSSRHDSSCQSLQTDPITPQLIQPQPIKPQPIKPQQSPQPHPVQPQPPLRIIVPPPVAGGLYGLKGVFPQPKRGGRTP